MTLEAYYAAVLEEQLYYTFVSCCVMAGCVVLGAIAGTWWKWHRSWK